MSADIDRGVAGGEQMRIHQIDPGQKFIGRIDIAKVFPRNAQKRRNPRPQAEENGGKTLAEKLVDRLDFADDGVQTDLHAELF